MDRKSNSSRPTRYGSGGPLGRKPVVAGVTPASSPRSERSEDILISAAPVDDYHSNRRRLENMVVYCDELCKRATHAEKLSFVKNEVGRSLSIDISSLESNERHLKSANDDLMRWAYERGNPWGLMWYEEALRDITRYSDLVAQGRCRVSQNQADFDALEGASLVPIVIDEDFKMLPVQRPQSKNLSTTPSPSLPFDGSTSSSVRTQAESNDSTHPSATESIPKPTSSDILSPGNDHAVTAGVEVVDNTKQPPPLSIRSRPANAIVRAQHGARWESVTEALLKQWIVDHYANAI